MPWGKKKQCSNLYTQQEEVLSVIMATRVFVTPRDFQSYSFRLWAGQCGGHLFSVYKRMSRRGNYPLNSSVHFCKWAVSVWVPFNSTQHSLCHCPERILTIRNKWSIALLQLNERSQMTAWLYLQFGTNRHRMPISNTIMNTRSGQNTVKYQHILHNLYLLPLGNLYIRIVWG